MYRRLVSTLYILVLTWTHSGCTAIGARQGAHLDAPFVDVPKESVLDSTAVGKSFRAETLGGLRIRGKIAGTAQDPSDSRQVLLYRAPSPGILSGTTLERVDAAGLEDIEMRVRDPDRNWTPLFVAAGLGLDVGAYLLVRQVMHSLGEGLK